ncbi:vesicle transport through interaction with t-SNAREs homolog 1A isoform X3 [Zootermopsis nevadensis]|uniref:vesicle transport through interaction with t-SNAREs homolog 1A isoform X3 n=1 Tax=Zootermopsis nevadensis TaxID=136037 RepID=UPI000B8E6024|nr:vesicle transport through interaction with t-SNAREs homolog 1A isoform X3 [Zootermopsis nevadensis]
MMSFITVNKMKFRPMSSDKCIPKPVLREDLFKNISIILYRQTRLRWYYQALVEKMASLMENYEQQYAVLTADITAKIGKLTSSHGADKKTLVLDVERHMEEAQELLEQMELEVREVEASTRPRLRTRVDSYRAELGRLSQEFMKVRSPPFQDGLFGQDDVYGSGVSMNEEQKLRLLDNSERLERTGHHLTTGYRIILETEEIGSQVLQDLHAQRETIQKSRSRNLQYLQNPDATIMPGSVFEFRNFFNPEK